MKWLNVTPCSLYYWSTTYHIHSIDSAKLKTLILRVQDYVHHSTHLRRNNVIRRDKRYTLFEPLLERCICPLDTRLDHITRHQFETLFQMASEFLIRPVQPSDEGLQCVQLPEEVLRCGTSVALDFPSLLLESLVNWLSDRSLHQIHVPNDQWRECVPKMLMELPVLQVV